MIEIILKWVFGVFLIYMISLFIHHFLDKVIKRGRLDNLILYRLTSKSPLASTKVILETEKRPKINDIQKKIEKVFENKRFDENKIINQSNYQFKIKGYPTAFRIRITEGDTKNPFTITLETINEDKIPFFLKGYFLDTINILEETKMYLNC